jgi:hypothetical protein
LTINFDTSNLAKDLSLKNIMTLPPVVSSSNGIVQRDDCSHLQRENIKLAFYIPMIVRASDAVIYPGEINEEESIQHADAGPDKRHACRLRWCRLIGFVALSGAETGIAHAEGGIDKLLHGLELGDRVCRRCHGQL